MLLHYYKQTLRLIIATDLREQSGSMVTSQPESELQVLSLSRLGCGGPGRAAMLAPGSFWNNHVMYLIVMQTNAKCYQLPAE